MTELEVSPSPTVWKKAKEKMEKLGRRRESNPGPLASATSALKENVKVLEVEGCRSSVVIAQVAEASGPGFDSR